MYVIQGAFRASHRRYAESFQLPRLVVVKVSTPGKCYADRLYTLIPTLGEKFFNKNSLFEKCSYTVDVFKSLGYFLSRH